MSTSVKIITILLTCTMLSACGAGDRLANIGKAPDFTPIVNVNSHALPSGMRSEYFDVSSRVIVGASFTCRRRSMLRMSRWLLGSLRISAS